MAHNKIEVDEKNAEVAASLDFDNPEEVEIIEDPGLTGDFKSTTEDNRVVHSEVVVPPKMDDISWTAWVMSQFEPSELDQGLPKANGLRRLVRKLIGPIISAYPDTRQCPTIENEHRATVEYTVIILNRYQLEDGEEPYEMRFGDVADAYLGNIRGLEYARFPSAMAATRAQVRALRMALNLAVVASEEVSDQPLEESGLTGKITESQITKIDIKCQQLDIDVIKFINMGKLKYNSITDVGHKKAIDMFAVINKYQQYDPTKADTGLKIPDSIKGYRLNWRDDS